MIARGLFVLMAASQLVAGQQARFSAPVLGYVYDAGARSLRVIGGVPGAAAFEDSIALDLDRTFLPAGRRYSISEGAEGKGLRLLRWLGREIAESALPSAGFQPEQIVFSPSGEAAAVYFRDLAVLEVWAYLPDRPELRFRIQVEAALRGLAVSDDASAVVATEESGSLVLLTNGSRRVIDAVESYSAIAFRAGSLDIAAADSALDRVMLIRNVTREAQASVVAGPNDGIAGPVAVAFSADNAKLVVANGRSESIMQLDLETRQFATVACQCKPQALERLRGNSVFRLTSTFKTDVFFFDGDSAEPRVFAAPGSAQ